MDSNKLIKNCGIPRDFAKTSLDEMDFSIYDPVIESIVRELDTKLRSGTFRQDPVFLMIDGEYGNGKTRTACHLVAAAYRGYIDNPAARGDVLRPYFAMASEAASVRFDEDSDLRAYLDDSVFLALDDINRLSGYKGEGPFVEMLIERRYYRGMSTIVTVNGYAESISGRFGSFLKQFGRLYYADAPDQRGY